MARKTKKKKSKNDKILISAKGHNQIVMGVQPGTKLRFFFHRIFFLYFYIQKFGLFNMPHW